MSERIRTKLSEREIEAEYGISVRTLQGWRFQRKGPPFKKFGGTIVRYDRAELERWIAQGPGGGDRVQTAPADENLTSTQV